MKTMEMIAKEQETRTQRKAPCQYSIEELKVRLNEGRIAASKGEYKTQSEMRRKYIL